MLYFVANCFILRALMQEISLPSVRGQYSYSCSGLVCSWCWLLFSRHWQYSLIVVNLGDYIRTHCLLQCLQTVQMEVEGSYPAELEQFLCLTQLMQFVEECESETSDRFEQKLFSVFEYATSDPGLITENLQKQQLCTCSYKPFKFHQQAGTSLMKYDSMNWTSPTDVCSFVPLFNQLQQKRCVYFGYCLRTIGSFEGYLNKGYVYFANGSSCVENKVTVLL
ncbi:hypothetical protein BaRGS_00017084 [Batillaria attramentaria]|uniref:Uncharacterized protein n=1 Tax=Batillaria attramentaria TaxID=370345 RepID=A0ABD0KX72_9CAEN